MSNDLKFKRKFFILKREYSTMRNTSPKGHGKLELRNNRLNISINIENAERNTSYNVILVGDNKYELGKIHTDDRSNGKADFSLNYKEIESIGFPLEKINGILILRDTSILLGAYIDKDDKSIDNYIHNLSKTDIKEEIIEESYQVEEMEDLVEEEIQEVEIDDKYFEEEEYIEEDQYIGEGQYIQDEQIDDQYTQDEQIEEEQIEEQFIEEEQYIENDLYIEDVQEVEFEKFEEFEGLEVEELVEDLEDEEIIPLDDPPDQIIEETRPFVSEEEYDRALQEMFKDGEGISPLEETECLSPEDQSRQNHKDQTINYVLNILRYFPFEDPFKIDLMGYNWWRIDVQDPREDKGFLPYFSYVANGNNKYPLVQNTVTATELIRQHGHYLFGLYNNNDDIKFYVYGVPGDFTIDDHPQRGSTGFNTWFEGQDNIGYWLLYIDPSTGRIMYPINPMIPKD